MNMTYSTGENPHQMNTETEKNTANSYWVFVIHSLHDANKENPGLYGTDLQ